MVEARKRNATLLSWEHTFLWRSDLNVFGDVFFLYKTIIHVKYPPFIIIHELLKNIVDIDAVVEMDSFEFVRNPSIELADESRLSNIDVDRRTIKVQCLSDGTIGWILSCFYLLYAPFVTKAIINIKDTNRKLCKASLTLAVFKGNFSINFT